MVNTVKTRNGLDIPMSGTPDPRISAGKTVRTVAVLGRDYVGLKPRMSVHSGDRVYHGDTLFVDKRDPDVPYTSPGSGTISAVNRGARRTLLSVVIDLDTDEVSAPSVPDLAGVDVDKFDDQKARAMLISSGLWPAFRTRPYNKVPQSDSSPRSIFVTAMDTNPLAANPATVILGKEKYFAAGLRVIAKLTEGTVFVCTGSDWAGPVIDNDKIQHSIFSGPHPAGLAGTHIHHLDPVGADRTVWHIGYQEVIAIGIFFTDGRVTTERIVAISGSGVKKPRLVATRLGANIDELLAGELNQDGAVTAAPRVVSGSVLDGRTATGAEAFLGRYHYQVSVVPDRGKRRLFGWFGPINRNYTFTGLFKRRQPGGSTTFSSASHGRPTAMMPIDAFEKIIPMDIVPSPLLRALLIGDTDQAQALGCLELAPEDLALCSFVCPGKNNYGAVLQANLEQIEREG